MSFLTILGYIALALFILYVLYLAIKYEVIGSIFEVIGSILGAFLGGGGSGGGSSGGSSGGGFGGGSSGGGGSSDDY
jgi:uncharacterized protein